MTKFHDGQYHAAPRRKGDHPSVHHRRKKKILGLEDIAEGIIAILATGTLAYLGAKGYLPQLGHQGLQDMNQKYSMEYKKMKYQFDKIKTDISTNSF